MIIGTLGHVDHGKSALVSALCARAFDRLPEEQRRGMTVELNFAPLTLPSGRTVGVVDVPGHERLLKTMAAGAGGLDVAMLVVAADEGVAPQTREHLWVSERLGVGHGVVVLTKADLPRSTDPLWERERDEGLAALTRGTAFEHAPRLLVSAREGRGLRELMLELDRALVAASPRRQSARERPLFVPIDRAFSLRGFGMVVTGTVWSGQLSADDAFAILPSPSGPLRARRLEVHHHPTSNAGAGDRVALNLPSLQIDHSLRGEVLTHHGLLEPHTTFEVMLTVRSGHPAALNDRARALITLGTTEVEATISLPGAALTPGMTGPARLTTRRPVAALCGMRFIARGTIRSELGSTWFGGEVLGLGRRPARRRAPPVDLLGHLTEAGPAATTERALWLRTTLGAPELRAALDSAVASGHVLALEPGEAVHFAAASHLEATIERARRWLETQLASRDEVSVESLRQHHLTAHPELFARALQRLERDGFEQSAGQLRRRQRGAEPSLTGPEKAMLERLRQRGLEPPAALEWMSVLRLTAAGVRELGESLVQKRLAIRAGELFFATEPVEALWQAVLRHFESSPELTFAQLKALAGVSRKFVVPLAERFDADKRTLRVGDVRRLRRASSVGSG